MAQIVGAGALSHSPIINANIDPTPDEEDQIADFRQAARELGERIAASKPDAIVIFGPDHFRGFFYDVMPPFCVGTGTVAGWGDWGTTADELPTNADLARHVHRELIGSGFDAACSYDLRVDHGFTQVVPLLDDEALLDIPIVPIFVNCAAPPLPTFRRCRDLGRAVGEAIRAYEAVERIVILASGGLSHTVPSADIDRLERAEAEKLIHGKASVLSGAGKRERSLLDSIGQFAGGIDEDWDGKVLRRFEAGEGDILADELSDTPFAERGGNGGGEVRTWIAMAAAAGGPSFQTLSYEPVPILITGMGVIAARI